VSSGASNIYLKTLSELGLLLVYYSETEIDLVGLLEIRLDLHDLRESLLGIVVATIAIVENANSVPEHRILSYRLVSAQVWRQVPDRLRIFAYLSIS
jgi:hypothetical protein